MPIFLLPLVAAALRIASLLTLATAAASDIDRRIISNRTALLMFSIGVDLRFLINPHGLAPSVFAAAAVYLGLVGLTHLKLLGAGDVKLIAAASFYVPANEVPTLLLDIAIAGGIVCVGFFVERGNLRDRAPVPYGVAIVAATAYRILSELSS